MKVISLIGNGLNQVSTITEGLLGQQSINELKKKIGTLNDKLKSCEYIKVPFIGRFSAGKSSLLNMLMGRGDLLPIDTQPKTAIAYELYYDVRERVELYKNGKQIDEKDIKDINTLDTEPGEIAKVYIDCEYIKKLQDNNIILVDMPGIGSGIERHDAAIANYLHKGSVFVLFVNAIDGALKDSTLVFTKELINENQLPVVFLTKTDMVPNKETVKENVEYVEWQLKEYGVENPIVSSVCAVNNDIESLNKFVNGLNADEIIGKQLSVYVKSIVEYAISNLQIRIDVRNADIKNLNQKVAELERQIHNLQVQEPFDEDCGDSPEKSTNDILANVKKALLDSSETIASLIVNGSGSEEEIKEIIVGTIRTEIKKSLKKEGKEYAEAISESANEIVGQLLQVNLDYTSENSMDKSISEFVSKVEILVAYLPEQFQDIARTILEILPFLTSAINAILDLFGFNDEERIEKIKSALINNAMPLISAQLKPTILQMVSENQEAIRNQMTRTVIAEAEAYKQGLLDKISDTGKSEKEIESEIEKLQNAIKQLHEIDFGIS